MLPSKNRLLAKRDFEEIKKKGQKFQGKLFGLLVLSKKGEVSRFGFILSTKLSKRAVRRNRAKRLLREAVRKILPQVNPGFDVVFLGKKEILDKTLVAIEGEIKRVFTTAGVINAKDRK